MKNVKKLLVLSTTLLGLLAACNAKPSNEQSKVESNSTVSEVSNVTSETSSASSQNSQASSQASSATASSQASSKASSAASSAASTSASTSTSTSTSQQANSYKVGFRNTIAGTNGDAFNTKVKDFVNQTAGVTFVSAVSNSHSQVASVDDSKGKFTVLQVGSSNDAGKVEFTFSQAVKSIVLELENYNKDYIDSKTGQPGSSQDTASKLYVNDATTPIDLAATAGNPTKKTETVDINSTTLKLEVKAGKNRVFVNAITFVL